MATVISEAQSQARELRSSLLAAAFSGKLVPQDPDEEPAAVVLDRIRRERATTPIRKRAARTRRAPRKTAPPGQEELPE
jgi:type I restriction enzyme S subunit